MSLLKKFGTSGEETSGKLEIVNESDCSFKKISHQSQQMINWNDGFPSEIQPNSQATVLITFDTRDSKTFDQNQGEVNYQVLDNAGLTLGGFTIRAKAEQSIASSFKGTIEVDWDTLTKVFGLTVSPRDGTTVGFKVNGTVSIKVEGKVLQGGPRDEDREPKATEWKPWNELAPECTPGDVIGVDRQAYKHYGVIHSVATDGTVTVCHLSGTAEDVLTTHGLGHAVKECRAALRPGSHGGIAVVQLQGLEEYTGKDLCRIENIYEDHWKPYSPKVLANRMRDALGIRDYSLFEFNCEHFANLIRYGMPYSAQIEAMKKRFDEEGLPFKKPKEKLAEQKQKMEKQKEKMEAKVEELHKRQEQWSSEMDQKASAAKDKIRSDLDRFAPKHKDK